MSQPPSSPSPEPIWARLGPPRRLPRAPLPPPDEPGPIARRASAALFFLLGVGILAGVVVLTPAVLLLVAWTLVTIVVPLLVIALYVLAVAMAVGAFRLCHDLASGDPTAPRRARIANLVLASGCLLSAVGLPALAPYAAGAAVLFVLSGLSLRRRRTPDPG